MSLFEPNKRTLVLSIAGIAFILNLLWENAQAPWYQGYGGFWQHFPLCLAGAVGDVVIILLLYFGTFFIPNFWRYLVLVIAGFAIGVGIETIALETGRWAYAEAMPAVPGFEAGLLPVLQMMILPSLTLLFAGRLIRK